MNIEKVCKDIKSLKVQGAEHIAEYALKAIVYATIRLKPKNYLKRLEAVKKKLLSARKTEPEMKNLLGYYLLCLRRSCPTSIGALKKSALNCYDEIISLRALGNSYLISNGVKLLSKADCRAVFTHCHSSSVVGILKAYNQKHKKKKLVVYNTETRPRFQGRITAKELAKAKIRVVHTVDSAARLSIKRADLVLLGADAITSSKVYNKIGSEMFCEIARNYRKPVYVCASVWKYAGTQPEIEERTGREVWNERNKRIIVENPAFEKIRFRLIKGIVCEYGILKPRKFAGVAKRFLEKI